MHVQLSRLMDHVVKVIALDRPSLEHMKSCVHCRLDLQWLEQLEALRNFEPPRSAVEAALKTFKQTSNAA